MNIELYYLRIFNVMSSLVAQMVVGLQRGRPGFHPWVRKVPWRRAWQPTSIFLPGESHGLSKEPGRLQATKSQTRLSN